MKSITVVGIISVHQDIQLDWALKLYIEKFIKSFEESSIWEIFFLLLIVVTTSQFNLIFWLFALFEIQILGSVNCIFARQNISKSRLVTSWKISCILYWVACCFFKNKIYYRTLCSMDKLKTDNGLESSILDEIKESFLFLTLPHVLNSLLSWEIGWNYMVTSQKSIIKVGRV